MLVKPPLDGTEAFALLLQKPRIGFQLLAQVIEVER
jgi:hypothetical protein